MTAAVTAADPRYTWRTVLLSALVAIIPIAVSVSWKAKALPMLALVVVGIIMMFRQADTRTRYRIVRAIVIVGLLRFAYAVFSIAWHGLGWGELDLPAQTLIFLCTAAAFTAVLDWRLIWTIFALTTCVLGGSCIVQHHLLGVERAYGTNGGDWSAIEFTMVTLCMVLFSILRLIQPGVSRGERLLHALAIAIGAYGAILTQSRGPMLAFVPSLLVVVAVHVRRTGRWHGAALCVGVLVAGVITATTALNHQVMHRFGEVHGEISSFNEHNVAGPVRERLAMWEVAGQAFREHPLDGVGIDQFGSFTRELATRGDASPIIARYDHPHNEYLEAAATGGVPLLIITLLVFVLPAVHFLRRLGHPDEWTAMLATAGLALVVMYALSAFTDNVFYRAMPHSFYMYLVFGLALATALPTRVAHAGRREATG